MTAPLTGIGIDPSSPSAEPLYRYVQADLATVERAVAVARGGAAGWRGRSGERAAGRAASRSRPRWRAAARHAASVMARDAGKTVAEGDPEVSEAIDFARYYGDHGCRALA